MYRYDTHKDSEVTFFNRLNGWQRLFTLLSLLWLPIFSLSAWHGLPVPPSDLPDDLYASAITTEMKSYLRKQEFNPDKYLAEKKAVGAKCIINSNDYKSANQGTKRFIFNYLIEKKLSYVTADDVEKKAIRDYLKITDEDLREGSKINEAFVDPDVADKVIANVNRNFQKDNCDVKIEIEGRYYSASGHSLDEIKMAHQLAKDILQKNYYVELTQFFGVRIFQFFLSLMLVYGFGWMIAWVRKGFAK